MSSSSELTSWALLSSSIVGADHQRRGAPIQDYAMTESFGDGTVALVVADGHGGERHFRSATGARLGCEVLVELVGDILSVSRDPARALAQLSDDSCASVLDRWRQRIRTEVSADPFRWDDADLLASAEIIARRDADVAQQWIDALCGETERSDSTRISAYGTTLLGIVVLPSALWWFQLGDGSLIEVAGDGRASLLCEPHSSAIADATPSMSTEGARRYVRTGSRPINGDTPMLLAAVSDGFSNSFEDTAGMMGFFEGALPLAREYGCDALGDFVPGWLGEMTQAGSGDDITVAWALDRCVEAPR
jgi:Protein phosphatase 2C